MTLPENSQPILHGPTKTNRFGLVLTLDITAPQRNLVVERGSSIPRASIIVTTLARQVIDLSKEGTKLDHLVVMGSDGPPSAHPDLREITENLRALRDKWFPRAKLVLITDGMDLAPEARQSLLAYDKLIQEFHWGTAKTFQSMTGEKGTVLGDLTRQLGYFDKLIVQARFASGTNGNSTDSEIKNWIKKLQEVRPQEVHILEGAPNSAGRKLRPVTKSRTQEIAEFVTEKTGITVSMHEDETFLVSA